MNKTLILAGLMVLAAAGAEAQSFNAKTSGNVTVGATSMNSATTPPIYNIRDAGATLNVYVSGTAATTSYTIVRLRSDGVALTADTARNATTAVSNVSLTAPQGFQRLVVSPTAGLTGTNTFHVTIVESK